MTWGRMRGREDIEWKDRSWRLLENEGEVVTDWWVLGGGVAGAVGGLVRARRGVLPVTRGTAVVGGAGLGAAGAGVGYMVSSYMRWREPR